MKGNPKLANDLKLIWFEREFEPKNADSWTDVDTGLSTVPNWDVLCDTPENVTIQPNYVDVKSGNCCVEYYMSANPGNYLEMRLTLPTAIDITTFTRLKVWFKRQLGIAIDANGLNFYMETQDSWLGRYYKLEDLAPPAVDTWVEKDLLLSSFTPVNSPCKWVTRVNIRIESSIGIGVAAVRIDRLRFERDEKHKTASDATSQSKYGKRRLVRVVKTIKTDDFAQKAVDGMLEHLKRPLVTVQVKTKGKAQVGFRPPQQVTIYSAKDGLNGAIFQIVSAKHHYVPEDIYQCDLELAAARNHDNTLEPEVVPTIPSEYLGTYLSRMVEEMEVTRLSMRERDYQP